MTATGCPDDTALALLAEGRLAAEARRAIEAHLDACLLCSEVVGELGDAAADDRGPGRYRRVRALGAGAMGTVWEGYDVELRRPVALKAIRGGPASAAQLKRLQREARVLARLRHPNVLAVHDLDASGDGVQIVLELVHGLTAREWAAAGRATEEHLALWMQVGAGLAAVHDGGMVHRDVKPDNVLVADDGRVLLADFGLATSDDREVDGHATESGHVVGTPAYMAPEQLVGGPCSAASDQFALCVCLWEALRGARPFVGATAAALALEMNRPLVVPPDPTRALLGVLARGLAPQPERRWPSVAALLAALERAQRRGPPSRPPRAVTVASALAVAALSALLLDGAARGGSGALREAREPARATAFAANTAPHDEPTVPRPEPLPRGTSSVAARAASPLPLATTSPAATPAAGAIATQSEARRLLDRASTQLVKRDGSGCLATLAALPGDAPAPEARAARARCWMLAGDCARGRAELDAAFAAQQVDATRRARLVDDVDVAFCPIDAPPRSRWADRAVTHLQWARSSAAQCRAVLAQVDRLGVVLSGRQARDFRLAEAACQVRMGRCDLARSLFARALAPPDGPPDVTANTGREKASDAEFDRGFPDCKKK